VSGTVVVLGGASAALLCAGVAGLIVKPTPRLAGRVRPYTIVARAGLGRSADVLGAAHPVMPVNGGVVRRLFWPPLQTVAARVGRSVETRSDEQLRLELRQAGYHDLTTGEYRARALGQAVLFTTAGATIGIATRSTMLTLVLAVCGLLYGSTRWKGRIDRAIEDRRDRLRLELYTVNQLLAIHLRTGAGPVQATQRIVDRGTGAMVEELDAVLTWVRSGVSEPEAFRRAAEVTPEPSVARTYKLFAAGAERGVDLAGALRALSEDLRDARREDLRRIATKRRAAMLVPTIAILAPIMLLFIAAPLPSVIFGSR
jgi:tight adherence protein C